MALIDNIVGDQPPIATPVSVTEPSIIDGSINIVDCRHRVLLRIIHGGIPFAESVASAINARA